MNKARPLKALIVSNGIEGLDRLYRDNGSISYDLVEVDAHFSPDLTPYDVLLAPNGTDHVAMYRIRDRVAEFLNRGGTLMCFDGWFTDWIPGHRWVMDNSKRSIEVRYRLRDDPHGLRDQFDLEALNFTHGISGWWACGYIEADPRANVLLEDTWGRPLCLIDTATTPGTIILTASGPLGDASYATTDDDKAYQAMTDLYQGLVSLLHTEIQVIP